MDSENPKDIYSSMSCVWPDDNRWYNYTRKYIVDFIAQNLAPRLSQESVFLNAGSGGSEYNLRGICHHVDIAENLINKFKLYTVTSIEKMPFEDNSFNSAICVGSVLNYCDAVTSLRELSRVIKHGGYLILEYERSNTGELWLTSEYGKNTTKQQYNYMGHTHTLWLYSEKVVEQILKECGLDIIKRERFHCISALVNRITHEEEYSGKFARYDTWVKPLSYLMAHNIIVVCQKL